MSYSLADLADKTKVKQHLKQIKKPPKRQSATCVRAVNHFAVGIPKESTSIAPQGSKKEGKCWKVRIRTKREDWILFQFWWCGRLKNEESAFCKKSGVPCQVLLMCISRVQGYWKPCNEMYPVYIKIGRWLEKKKTRKARRKRSKMQVAVKVHWGKSDTKAFRAVFEPDIWKAMLKECARLQTDGLFEDSPDVLWLRSKFVRTRSGLRSFSTMSSTLKDRLLGQPMSRQSTLCERWLHPYSKQSRGSGTGEDFK